MKPTVAVAGATGKLGGRIVTALLDRGADVRALARTTSAGDKVARLEQRGVEVRRVDLADVRAVAAACQGAACVVSALLGLRAVLVDAQSSLLEGAIAAGVPRFIPSDYAIDFSKLRPGENRNLDLHREFFDRLRGKPIVATSVLNGAFAETLTYGTPLLDRKGKRVTYWGDAEQPMDFTTMDDTARFTAAAALDASAPQKLCISGDRLSARDLAGIAGEVDQAPYELTRGGDLDDLAAAIKRERAASPDDENQPFPRWQGLQYLHNMFGGQALLEPLSNDRYPDLTWTSVRTLLAAPRR